MWLLATLGQVMALSGAFSHQVRCLAVSVWIMKIVMTICSEASRDNYHKPHRPSTVSNMNIIMNLVDLYPPSLYRSLKEKNTNRLTIISTLAFECWSWDNFCCSPPNWLSVPWPAWWWCPPPVWAGSRRVIYVPNSCIKLSLDRETQTKQ